MASTLFQGTKHAMLYSKFRPTPPHELIDSILTYLRSLAHTSFKQAVDIGCGSGQSTIVLAPHFEKVIGFDISEAQIECARSMRSLPNVEYRVSNCDKLLVPSSTVQLVTLSQSLHWFNTSQLFSKIKQVLVPNGVVAAYGYWIPLPKIQDDEKTMKISKLICEDLHDNLLGKYWDEGRYILQKHYSDIIFPFKDIQRLNFLSKSESSLHEYIGYLSTWSSYQKLCKEDSKTGERILKEIESQCLNILGQNKASEEIIFPLHTDYFMLIGHH